MTDLLPGGSFPGARLISEAIEPDPKSFSAAAMAQGEPGVPSRFRWRDRDYRVRAVLGERKTLRSCRSGSAERYIHKHMFTLEMESGEIMTVYRTRSGSRKDSWMLYTIEDGHGTAAGTAVQASPLPVAVLVSGGGTNLQALIDAEQKDRESGIPDYEIVLVIADREGCYALERAARAGIPTALALPPGGVTRPEARRAVSDHVLELAREARAKALVLAGYLTIMSGPVIDRYAGRMINLHPALLPKFGGKGMWGHHVHEAVLASGEAESGCTVHLVDAGCDTGDILLQRRVPVLPGDTADTLAGRIHGEEHLAIVEGTRILARRLRGDAGKP